jgi:hypothetical protein
VRAVDLRRLGQRAQARKAPPHLLRRALEQAAAAHDEQGVAAKQRVAAREPIGDVAARVAGNEEDLGALLAEIVGAAVADLDVDAGNAVAVVARPHDGAAGRRLDLEIAAGVVGVMVRVEDMRDAPLAAFSRRQHRLGHGGVDDGGHVRGGLVDEPDVIVLEDGNALDLEPSHGCLALRGNGCREPNIRRRNW